MSDIKDWARSLGAADVRTAAAGIGVELRGDEGQPYHCGARMTVRSGIFGADYAKCEVCMSTMLRIDSPHTNGGQIFSTDDYATLGDDVWIVRDSAPSLSRSLET